MSCTPFVLLLLASPLVVAGPRHPRQIWSFPGEDNTPRPNPNGLPTRGTTSTRQVPEVSTSTTTPAPGVVFQIPNCNCLSPPQYNPVCGTDGVTYGNLQKLNCARSCGTNVQMGRLGVCQTPRR